MMEVEDPLNKLKTALVFEENASVSGELSLMDQSVRSDRMVLGQLPDIANNYRTPCPVMKFSRRRWDSKPQRDYLSFVEPYILQKIFSFLNKRDLISVMSTCRLLRSIGLDRRFWKFLCVSGKHLSESVFHWLCDRQVVVLNASSTMIYHSEFFSWYDFHNRVVPPAALTHLDLSMTRFSSTSVLRLILSRCSKLKALSLEQCYDIDESIFDEIAENDGLQYLNLVMAKHVTADGLAHVLESCDDLRELNIGWVDYGKEMSSMLAECLPPSLRRLNISGINDAPDMSDETLRKICERCKQMEELDVSDCANITAASIEHLNALPKLSTLSLSRCYGIEPTAFLQLKNLRVLNIFGCVTDEGADFLRSRLRPTAINFSPLSTIARPTVGDSVTSIWRCRTRDWY